MKIVKENYIEAYIKKSINFSFRDCDLSFDSSQSLFSSHKIDLGTKRLLRSFIFEGVDDYKKVLDLGCGYGPVGISLKAAYRSAEVHMVDRDALALAFAAHNARLNNLDDMSIYASVGYGNIEATDFDLIVSNIPAKMGEKALRQWVSKAGNFLSGQGRVAVVVIDAIASVVEDEIDKADIEVVYKHRWPGHQVFHYRFNKNQNRQKAKAGLSSGVYDRAKVDLEMFEKPIKIETTYNLSEFDSLGYRTEILLENLYLLSDYDCSKLVVFGIGQGYLPVALVRKNEVKKIFLIDRDYQALQGSERNLDLNGYRGRVSTIHDIGLGLNKGSKVNCVVGVLDEKEKVDVLSLRLTQAEKILLSKGAMLLSSSSRIVTLLEELIGSRGSLTVKERNRVRGKSVILIEKD